MKIEWRTCFRIGVSIFLLYLAIHYLDGVAHLLSVVLGAAVPLILGAVIAYILNILMCFYERYYFPSKDTKAVVKSRRIVCMLAAFLTLVVIVVFIVSMVIPELVSCIQLFAQQIMIVTERLLANKDVAELLPEEWFNSLSAVNWQERLSQIMKFLSSGISGMFGTTANLLSSLVSSIVNWLIGLIFAIYLLLGKEKIRGQVQRVTDNYIKPKWNQKIRYVLSILNECFHNYIVGQCIEAVILGSLCALGMTILQLPYAAMVGVLVGFTAFIPVAGAYIGAGVGAFMILTVSPIKALIFLVFIVVLQQLEGNLIYPKVVGSSVGLPGIWVLAAVTIGGGISGVIGMLLSVPVAASLYRLLRADVCSREQKKEALEANAKKEVKKEVKKEHVEKERV